MVFSNLLNDIVAIKKPNGEMFENVKASVQHNTIIIFDVKLPLEENDKIYRQLPSGQVEVYVVEDRGFINAPFHKSMSHFEAKVKREGSVTKDEYKSIVIKLEDNARINSTVLTKINSFYYNYLHLRFWFFCAICCVFCVRVIH
ncbi:MAG: hypothetical protein LBT09_11030 [Planctomycetaceae bacterium]|jgi:hypothetical protein|nr:hypothetical protein [Planctomycetaceae bacterium]